MKEDNKQDIKFGASVTASYASLQATSSFDYASSQKQARENDAQRNAPADREAVVRDPEELQVHLQADTEVTDTSSTRHVLANTTNALINYELRRKMRQVGVQVQDIGTYPVLADLRRRSGSSRSASPS